MSTACPLLPARFTVRCLDCGEMLTTEPWQWRHSCGGTLRLEMDLDAITMEVGQLRLRGMARFAPVLPLQHVPVTPVGDTPLTMEVIDQVNVGLKLEYLNPGGSFKDRGAYVSLARCRELGIGSIVVDSSGNAGVAAALMGLRFGMGVDVFLPESTPEGKKTLLRVLGARLHEAGGDRMMVHAATLAYASARNAAYVGHWFNPYFAHGVKTIAYEAVEQMPQIDYVFCPVGAGTVLLGLHTGFSELCALRPGMKMPRLVAVQAAGYSPVSESLGVKSVAGDRSHLADGIAIASPPRRAEMVAAVKATGGFGVVVGDLEIAMALKRLIRSGYVVEPTSAVPLAGLTSCIQAGLVPAGSHALLPLTGTGMKVLTELEQVTRDMGSSPCDDG